MGYSKVDDGTNPGDISKATLSFSLPASDLHSPHTLINFKQYSSSDKRFCRDFDNDFQHMKIYAAENHVTVLGQQ